MKSFSQIQSRTIEVARLAGEAALSLLYPPHCAACQADTPSGSHLCAECAKQAQPIHAPRCHQCSMPFDGAIDGKFICHNCEGRQFHFACAVSPYRAKGVVRDFIHRFKYDRQFHLRHQLGEWLAAGLADERLLAHPIDAITPVPLHAVKEREREFNQAAVLAKLLARRTAKPVAPYLERPAFEWTEVMRTRRAYVNGPHWPQILEVKYEDLVADPERTTRRICGFLGEAFEPAMLDLQERVALVPERERSIHPKLGRPISSDAIGQWKAKLSLLECFAIEACLHRDLRQLGYPLRFSSAAWRPFLDATGGALCAMAPLVGRTTRYLRRRNMLPRVIYI